MLERGPFFQGQALLALLCSGVMVVFDLLWDIVPLDPSHRNLLPPPLGT